MAQEQAAAKGDTQGKSLPSATLRKSASRVAYHCPLCALYFILIEPAVHVGVFFSFVFFFFFGHAARYMGF